LTEYARHFEPHQTYKVRLLLSRTGEIQISHQPIESTMASREIGNIAIAAERTNSADKFFYHKTTHRRLYDEASQRARELGLADFIFLNERGEVSEGAISNVFVEKEGWLYTPPISSGILAGVYRAHILETNPKAKERVLKLEDLKKAERIWICNAVRGMREVKWVERLARGKSLGQD
jgi:para-aminobenzoate synthetase/4-amino-4-deoxychorismate lyase